MFQRVGWILLALSVLFFTVEVEAKASKKGTFKRYEMMTGKVKRSYWVFIPDIIKDAPKMSAVLAFHGKDMTAEKFHKFIDPGLEASDYAFMMVYPQARDNHWRAGRGPGVSSHWADDETFAQELIKKIIKEHKADPDRIFAMGYSTGAQMATKLACNHADKIYAAASIAHSMNEWGCNPSHEISMIYIQGMKDPIVPYKGGTDFKYASHLESVDFFREVNGIKSAARVVKVNDSLKCRHYSNQKRSTFVIGCRLYEDGHQYPGSKGYKKETYGQVNTSMDTNYFVLRRFYKLKAEKKSRDATKIVSKGGINAGMSLAKYKELQEVRKARYRKTLGITADQQGAMVAKAKAEAAARKKSASKIAAKSAASKVGQKQVPNKVAKAVPKAKPKPAAKPTTQRVAQRPAPKPAAKATTAARVQPSISDYNKFHTFDQYAAKHGLTVNVLTPKNMGFSGNKSLVLFVTPRDVSATQAAAILKAESRMLSHDFMLVHLAYDGDVSRQTLVAVQDVMEDIETSFALDGYRRFAIGYSTGGELLQDLYCDAPSSFRAMATISYSWRASECHPIPRLPLLVMQNKSDQRFPFSDDKRLGHKQLMDTMRAASPDLLIERVPVVGVGHRCTSWSELDSQPRLVSCVQDSGGNTVPGAGFALGGSYGSTSSSFDGPAYLYDFMSWYDDGSFAFTRRTIPIVSR